MPRSLLCGCLSKEAVDPMVERARERLVLPESTWPSTPTLMLSVFAGLGFDEDEDASASDMLASAFATTCFYPSLTRVP